MKRYSIITIFMIAIFISSLSCATDTEQLHYQLTPKSIIHQVQSRGAEVVVSELYRDWNIWNSILKKIASADEDWLRTAVALRAGSDAGTSEMLELSVGEALENNPVNVFRVTLKAFQLNSICSGPDVDDFRYNSYELSIKAINQRIRKVSAVTDRTLESTCKKCIHHLEASKVEIARFYGIKK